MNGLKTDDTIADWKAAAYDWRLSLDDLLNNGKELDGKIYYEESTSTPYIEQTLRALARTSKTSKVTIVAHSNGGLVAKALLNKLGSEASKSLVDKIIIVGAPQSGAPEAVGSLLVGYDAGIYWKNFLRIVSSSVAQGLAQNSPMAYHLLPSENYLASTIDDPTHPVVHFTGDGYADEKTKYGNSIVDISTLDNFLRDSSLNSSLIDYANSVHNTLDNWSPTSGIEVNQIAGWGANTVAGIDFYTTPQLADAITSLEPQHAYRPIFTEDGDGIVPIPSALMMASSTDVKRYWLNLDSYRKTTSTKRVHKDIFEIPQLEDFIKNIIENSTSTLPTYISTNQPPSNTENKKLTFFLHSPLTLQLADSSGNITGIATDDSVTEDIPGSSYGEFGEVKYLIVPEGDNYQLTMHGQASGTFSLDIQESSGNTITTSSTIANVPTTANTLAALNISGGIDTVSALTVDENGNGENVITISPVLGETVNYEPPAPVSEQRVSSSAGGGGSRSRSTSTVITVPASIATTTDSTITPQVYTTITEPIATSIVTVATSTVAIATSTKFAQIKKKTFAFIVPSKKANVNIPQTASMYQASQQSVPIRFGAMLYNSINGLWSAIKKLF